jgi:hypothetical protein
MLKCEARLYKTYKRSKAEPIWPRCRPGGTWIDNPEAAKYPVCGGDVTINVTAVAGMYYGEIELEIEETCTNCKHPYHKLTPFIDSARVNQRVSLTDLLNEI